MRNLGALRQGQLSVTADTILSQYKCYVFHIIIKFVTVQLFRALLLRNIRNSKNSTNVFEQLYDLIDFVRNSFSVCEHSKKKKTIVKMSNCISCKA